MTSYKEFKCFPYLLGAWAIIETFLLAGHKAGWSSLVYIFKLENIYQELCDTPSDEAMFNSSMQGNLYGTSVRNLTELLVQTGCTQQDARFQLVVTVSSVVSLFGSFVLNDVNRMYGIRATRVLGIFLLTGFVSYGFASSDLSWLIFVGYLCCQLGGFAVLQTNNQISYMFEKGGSTFIGIICGSFDASSFVMVLLKIGYEHGLSLKELFFIMCCLISLLVISTFFFLPRGFVSSSKTSPPEPEQQVDKQDETNPKSTRNDLNEFKHNVNEETKLVAKTGNNNTTSNRSIFSLLKRMWDTKATEGRGGTVSFFTPLFFGMISAVTLHQLIIVLFLNSLNAWLEHITDHDEIKVSYYTNIFMYTMLLAFVLSLLSGLGIDLLHSMLSESLPREAKTYYCLAGPFVVLSVIGGVLCGCVVVEGEPVLYVAAVLIVVYRSAFYSVWTVSVRLLYPSELFSIAFGVMLAVSGIFLFLQYPLFLWCESSTNGYRMVYTLLGVLNVAALSGPIYMVYLAKREIRLGQEAIQEKSSHT